MNRLAGVWIDHKKAVIVSASEGRITTRTVQSDVDAHPHYGGQQDGGGEKKYEERRRQSLARYYDEVLAHLGEPEALLIFGPGEAKLEFKERLGRSGTPSQLTVETAGRLTDPQIVAKVKGHFAIFVAGDL